MFKIKQKLNKYKSTIFFLSILFCISILVPQVIFAATAPTASGVGITGSTNVGQTLTGSYTYDDVDVDPEGVTTFRWMRAATSGGTYRAISGATSSTYVLTSSDVNQYIKFEVTPISTVSPTTGEATSSSATGVVYLLSDDFTGTVIDTTKWIERDTTGTGAVQNGNLSITGINQWYFEGIGSVSTFDHSVNDLVIEADIAYSDCGGRGGLFYGPWSNGNVTGDTAMLIRNSGVWQLWKDFALSAVVSGTCTNGVATHEKMVVKTAGGVDVYLNYAATPSGTLTAVQYPSSITAHNINFSFYHTGLSMTVDNMTVTDVRAVPGVPTGFLATGQNGQASLSWTAPVSAGSSAITDYFIEYKESFSSTWLTFADGVSTNTTTTITGLVNGTDYDFRVGATNMVGTGDAAMSSATPAATVSNEPTGLAATQGDTQVGLTWTGPSDIGGSAITDYLIEYKTGADSYATFADGVSTATATTVTGLTNGLTYTFRVSAVNGLGTSSPSTITTGVPVNATPEAPSAGSISISGRADVGQTLSGTYTYIDSNGDIEGISTFRWLRAATSAGTYRAITGATASTYVLTTSDLNQYIKFEVTPVTTVAPTSGSATLSSATGLVYLLSDDFTGSTIDTTTRWIERDSGTNVTQNGSLTAAGNNQWGTNGVFSQLTFDRSLNDLVIETDLTYSDCSLAKGGVYYDDTSNLPIGSLFFFRNGTSTQLYRWNTATANISTGYWTCANGVPVHVKFVINAVGGASVYLNSQASAGTSLTAVQAPNTWNNQNVSFQQYNTGTTANFDNVTITDTRAAPGEPTSFATSSQNNQVALSWIAPVSVGSSAITDYLIEYKATADSTWLTFADGVSTSTVVTVTGLTNATSYDFRVGAANEFATGDATATASDTPAATVPNPPTSLNATYGDTQTVLDWTAPSDVGLTVTDYVVEYKTGADAYATFTDGVSTATAATVTGLTNGLTYTFRVSAINGLGTSTPSGTTTAIPLAVAAEAPTATSISFSSRYAIAVGETLTGTYTFIDGNTDSEGTSTFRWLRSDTLGGEYTAISGETSSTYITTSSDLSKYIKFEVTPVSTVSPTNGSPTLSSATQVSSVVAYLHHILSTGQSLSVGLNGSPVLSATQPYSNVMLNGSSLTPLIESSVETKSSAMGNTITFLLEEAMNSQIGVTRHGVSATGYSGLKKGTVPYQNGMDQVATMKAVADELDIPYKVIGVTVIHGEGDFTGCNAAAYQGYLEEWQNDYETDVKAITGQAEDIPLFTDQMSAIPSSYGCTTDDMAVAQFSAAEDNPGNIIMVGPKYFLNYTQGIANPHLQNTSYRLLGEYYGKVIKKVMFDKETWVPLSPQSIVRSGNIIVAQFNVPEGPLVLDTSLVAQRTNYGFEYIDDTSSASISSVELLNSDSVKITLDTTPTGTNPYLAYAYTGTPDTIIGAAYPNSVGGNLRDSDSTPSLYGSNLYNWSVVFKKAFTLDSTAPSVSSVVATPSTTSASITWTTDENASTILDYGLTDTYGNSTSEANTTTRVTSHSASLSNLVACTTYHYRARSKDLPQNSGTSSDATFTTSGCVGSATVEGETSSTIMEDDGGALELIAGGEGLALTILSGSAGADTNFQIKKVDDAAVIAETGVPATYSLIGSHMYELKALSGVSTAITSFNFPITVDIYYDDADVTGLIESGLKIYRWDSTEWIQLSNCSVDTVENKVSCQTSNFSDFGLFGQDETFAPTGITVSETQSGQMTVGWTDNSDNETGFLVETSTDGISYTSFVTTAAGATSTDVTGLSANTSYWFRVASTDGVNNSSYATTASGTYTLAVAPTSVSVSIDSNTAIVTWSGGTASSYNVSKNGESSITGQSSAYTYTGLSCGTSYTFTVYGVNGDSLVTEGFGTVSASTSGCVGGGGGGGTLIISSTINIAKDSGVENIPNLIIAQNGLKFSAGNANSTVLKPTLIVNTKINSSILIPANTKVIFADGNPFVGTIPAPMRLKENELPKPLPAGLSYSNAIIINLEKDIFFDKKITITMPISEDLDVNNVKIYLYNKRLNAYELVGNGGKVSADGKFISAETNNLYIFVAASMPKNAFTDMIGHWAYEFVTKLHKLGVIHGREPYKFVPEGNTTRAEAVKIGLLTYGHYLDADNFDSGFIDLNQEGWYLPYISKAKKEGFISGTRFRPDEPMTRIDALVMLCKMANKQGYAKAAPFVDISQKSEAAKYVNYAYAKGIIQGKAGNKFDPFGTITRAEISKIAINIRELK